jgi:hypothetical protein
MSIGDRVKNSISHVVDLVQEKFEKFTSGQEWSRELGTETLLTIGGLFTSTATAVIVFVVAKYVKIDLSSIMVWFVIPVGSIGCGFVAASGYYLASFIANSPPTRQLAVNMVLVGFSTYALMKYLPYWTLVLEDGTPVSDVVSFWTYYQFSIESTQLQFHVRGRSVGRPTGELGGLGYVYEAIRFFGFLAGAFFTWRALQDRPYCADCRKYYKKQVILDKVSLESMNNFLAACGLVFPDIAERYEKAFKKEKPIGCNLVLHSCSSCDRKEFRFGFQTESEDCPVVSYPYRGDFKGAL